MIKVRNLKKKKINFAISLERKVFSKLQYKISYSLEFRRFTNM